MGSELAASAADVIPLAVQAAGCQRADETRSDYLARIRLMAVDLYLEMGEHSRLSRRLQELGECDVFAAVLVRVEVEQSTTRAVLHLRTFKEGDSAETIRTDRTDDPRGQETLQLARQLIGHRVLVYKLIEGGREATQKFRTAKHLVDLGAADDPAQPASNVGQARRHPDQETARDQIRKAIPVHVGGEAYRRACLNGIMGHAVFDGEGHVTNMPVLLELVTKTPKANTVQGKEILRKHGSSGQPNSADRDAVTASA